MHVGEGTGAVSDKVDVSAYPFTGHLLLRPKPLISDGGMAATAQTVTAVEK
jgi:hypothetical protein